MTTNSGVTWILGGWRPGQAQERDPPTGGGGPGRAEHESRHWPARCYLVTVMDIFWTLLTNLIPQYQLHSSSWQSPARGPGTQAPPCRTAVVALAPSKQSQAGPQADSHWWHKPVEVESCVMMSIRVMMQFRVKHVSYGIQVLLFKL